MARIGGILLYHNQFARTLKKIGKKNYLQALLPDQPI